MNWNDHTLNPKVLLGYYDEAPSLQRIVIHRVSLLRDGPTAEIVFDVGELPQRRSPKWPEGCNTCQITLRASGLTEVDVTQWGTGVVGELTVQPIPSGLELGFEGEARFRFVCSHLQVAGVAGYVDGRS